MAVPEVEGGQPGNGLLRTVCDLVQIVFHPSRERVVHEVGEVLLHERDGRKGGERRDQR